jgi:WD40 repeat protein
MAHASRKVERDPQLTEAELAASQSMIVWDAHKGYEWFRVRGVGSRDRLVISPDGKYVATLGAANVVQIWSDTDREVSPPRWIRRRRNRLRRGRHVCHRGLGGFSAVVGDDAGARSGPFASWRWNPVHRLHA